MSVTDDTHGIVIYVYYYDLCIEPEDGFFSRNMLLIITYKQSFLYTWFIYFFTNNWLTFTTIHLKYFVATHYI